MSPELLQRKQYDCLANDLYSIAVCTFILVTGLMPSDSNLDLFSNLSDTQNWDKFWSKVDIHVSRQFRDFFEAMIMPQSLRLSLQEMRETEWLQMASKGYLSVRHDIEPNEEISVRKTIR